MIVAFQLFGVNRQFCQITVNNAWISRYSTGTSHFKYLNYAAKSIIIATMKRAFLGKTVLILIVSILLTLGLGACSQTLDSLNTAAETMAT